ncbi:MAG TPA: response regulator [Candidatus Limnocylindrales bacterium]|nr:response regulator [Candidatus Limnocylindrales bacterium]
MTVRNLRLIGRRFTDRVVVTGMEGESTGMEAAGGDLPGSGWSVVLVDDDSATAEMYRLGLESLGFKVKVASDAAGLFSSINGRVPDVIVLDWQLRGVQGDQVLHQIRMDDRIGSVPVFMLSNFPATMDGAVDRVFAAGALAWFEKIKTPPALLATKLTEALRSRTER